MKDFILKRYKDYIGDRIYKGILSYFSNFSFTLDFNNFCDSVESFANQDEIVSIILLLT
jgi:hypothetical protein